VGEDIKEIVVDWIHHLKSELLFGNDDPLFPKTEMKINHKRQFEASGLKPEHWSNASPIRKIFKEAFVDADLQYFNPHSFRNTLATLGGKKCSSPEEFKAWSQNLGHERVLTTFTSYGEVQPQRQTDIFQQLKKPRVSNEQNTSELAKALAKELQKIK
jgi:integrase/recombinase XerD